VPITATPRALALDRVLVITTKKTKT